MHIFYMLQHFYVNYIFQAEVLMGLLRLMGSKNNLQFQWRFSYKRVKILQFLYLYIRLVVFKFVSWYSNSSLGIQIRLVVGKFILVVFKFLCRLRLIALDSTVGNCC